MPRSGVFGELGSGTVSAVGKPGNGMFQVCLAEYRKSLSKLLLNITLASVAARPHRIP
jgi:hypothetical protein